MAEPAISWEQLPRNRKNSALLECQRTGFAASSKGHSSRVECAVYALGAANTTAGIEATMQPVDEPGIRMGHTGTLFATPPSITWPRFDAGLNTTHIVLGSNLARLPWVKALLGGQ